MRLSLRPTSRGLATHDEAGVHITSRVLPSFNTPTYAALPTPKPSWSLSAFALRALAGSLDQLDLELDAPSLGLTLREDVVDELLGDEDEDTEFTGGRLEESSGAAVERIGGRVTFRPGPQVCVFCLLNCDENCIFMVRFIRRPNFAV